MLGKLHDLTDKLHALLDKIILVIQTLDAANTAVNRATK